MSNSHSNPRILYLRTIEQLAKKWERQGYKVKANLNDWSIPSKIQGLTPDLTGKRSGVFIIGNIEHESDVEARRAQWKNFVKVAEQDENISFRLYTINKSGKCTLYKLFE